VAIVSDLVAAPASPPAAAAVSIGFSFEAMRAAAGARRAPDSDGGARPGGADRRRPTVAAAAAAAAVERGNSVGDARKEEWRPAKVGSHSAPHVTKRGAKARRRSMVCNAQSDRYTPDSDDPRRAPAAPSKLDQMLYLK